ncbi:MAG: response regulator transcription factor [Anaerolineaceae bacterium]|nr:response regulator transcription factor [Anaerolineaceae bacterium]NTV35816.1 response regulator transcription factor [Anaerolineaceae bacterium]
MAQTILVVDDQPNVRKLIQEYMTEEGFRIVTAGDGQEALFVARREKPDLILLDLMMPGMGGYDFIRAFRKEQDTPVIVLTARLEETDKVVGLELGADDYVTKPFGMRELAARVRAVLRRADRGSKTPSVLRCENLTVDLDGHTTQRGDLELHLTPSEFDLLVILMSSPGRVFSRSELLDRLQGSSFEGIERTIDVHIRNLRAKIEENPAEPYFIDTVFGVGYRFRTG